MLAIFLCMLALKAVQEGTASHVPCSIEELPNVELQFIREPEGICRDFENINCEEIRENLTNCHYQDIFEIDSYTSMLKEFCNEDSDFQKNYVKHLNCTRKEYNNSAGCWDFSLYPEIKNLKNQESEDLAKELCTNTIDGMISCMNKYIANCGEEAVQISDRTGQYYKSWNLIHCLDAYRSLALLQVTTEDIQVTTDVVTTSDAVAEYLPSWIIFGALMATLLSTLTSV